MLLADLVNNTDVGFALALVGMILGIVALLMTGVQNVLAWGVVAVSLAGVLVWWPG